MTIEIRQLLIKSNIVQRSDFENRESLQTDEQCRRKDEVLAECRRMILEVLQEKGER